MQQQKTQNICLDYLIFLSSVFNKQNGIYIVKLIKEYFVFIPY
jgi:hypothetical protein